jgi:hypothetical protein
MTFDYAILKFLMSPLRGFDIFVLAKFYINITSSRLKSRRDVITIATNIKAYEINPEGVTLVENPETEK